jgi:hypothetical protein
MKDDDDDGKHHLCSFYMCVYVDVLVIISLGS